LLRIEKIDQKIKNTKAKKDYNRNLQSCALFAIIFNNVNAVNYCDLRLSTIKRNRTIKRSHTL